MVKPLVIFVIITKLAGQRDGQQKIVSNIAITELFS